MHRLFCGLAIASLWAMPAGRLVAQNQNGPDIRPNATPQTAPTQTRPGLPSPTQTRPNRMTHAFLGVHVVPSVPSSQTFQPGHANPPQGVIVQGLAPGSPAEKAGIKVGDTLTAV